jgi:oxygen-independent coproporphyrinogen-3 oxidase
LTVASLYLHIPFCERKCIYCDFYSIAPNGSSVDYPALMERFLDALETEIRLRGQEERFRGSYETVFFGGGTPSLLSPSDIGRILDLLGSGFSIGPRAEITLETNPGTVDLEKLKAFRSAGINRLSIGIQSFHDDDLQFLSRIHTADDVRRCIGGAFAAGFQNVSFDLIFSLPGQTMDRWRSNLARAVEQSPAHLSCYSLIVEPNTPLFRMVRSKQITPLDAERDAELYEFTMEFLDAHGYAHYEVSNFALPGYQCRHNVNYWNHTNYLGLGPSAHSLWESERWWNGANVSTYIAKLESWRLPLEGGEHLTESQLIDETIFLGLRSDGIDLKEYSKQFGRDLLKEYELPIAEFERQGLMVNDRDRLRLTPKGYLLCDEICQSFAAMYDA